MASATSKGFFAGVACSSSFFRCFASQFHDTAVASQLPRYLSAFNRFISTSSAKYLGSSLPVGRVFVVSLGLLLQRWGQVGMYAQLRTQPLPFALQFLHSPPRRVSDLDSALTPSGRPSDSWTVAREYIRTYVHKGSV